MHFSHLILYKTIIFSYTVTASFLCFIIFSIIYGIYFSEKRKKIREIPADFINIRTLQDKRPRP